MKPNKGVKSKPTKISSSQKSFNKWLLPVLVIITVVAFYSSVNNGFTNWDDDVNITKNADLIAFRGESTGYAIKNIFSAHQGMGMYAPLFKLSYLIQYVQYQLNPLPYHVLNLILHLLNCVLVFAFVWLLCRLQRVAFITALLFAIHPMHVESVAWIAGRIDLLYSFFYLSALCTYLLYLKHEKWRWHFYILTLLLCVLALLSKASAVTLPVAFFVLDYFLGRRITTKTVLAKAPFILLSFIFGYIAMYAQLGLVIQEDTIRYNFFDRGLFICYALMAYLWKLFIPINLACIYDYPLKQESGLFGGVEMYPYAYYIAPLITMAITYLLYKWQRLRKDLLFGFGFFLLNIVLVLPGFAVRHTIIADRYTYLSYIGLFFIMARWLNGWWENKSPQFQSLRTPGIVVFALFLVWCGYLTTQCCNVWLDSITLWSNAVLINPSSALGHENLGNAYLIFGKNEDALKEFNQAIQFNPNYAQAYFSRGCAYEALIKTELAIKDYNSAIRVNPNYPEAYNNCGNAYYRINQYDSAIKYYASAISVSPNYAEAYVNLGNVYTIIGKPEFAIKDCNYAITLSPYFTEAYYNCGNAYRALKQYENAIKSYSSAILVNPGFAQAYNNRSITYIDIQKFQLALDDAIKAQQLGLNTDPAVIANIKEKIKNEVQ